MKQNPQTSPFSSPEDRPEPEPRAELRIADVLLLEGPNTHVVFFYGSALSSYYTSHVVTYWHN